MKTVYEVLLIVNGQRCLVQTCATEEVAERIKAEYESKYCGKYVIEPIGITK